VSEMLALQRALLAQNPAVAEAAEAAEAAAAGSSQDAGGRKRGREGDAAATSGASQASGVRTCFVDQAQFCLLHHSASCICT
jgi:hypothetical protein